MVVKIIAVFALVALPLNLSMWHRSHNAPTMHRWDMTLYQSTTVYIREGMCGVHILSMPTKVASKSEFETPLGWDPLVGRSPGVFPFFLTSSTMGPYRNTWIVFPFWFPAAVLSFFGILPIVRGPVRQYLRKRRGLCLECGYDLRGTHGKRCSECGTHFR
jgi:hypothetical protein